MHIYIYIYRERERDVHMLYTILRLAWTSPRSGRTSNRRTGSVSRPTHESDISNNN